MESDMFGIRHLTSLYSNIYGVQAAPFRTHCSTPLRNSLMAPEVSYTIRTSIPPACAYNEYKWRPTASCRINPHINQHFWKHRAWQEYLCQYYLSANESLYQYLMLDSLAFDVTMDHSFPRSRLIHKTSFLKQLKNFTCEKMLNLVWVKRIYLLPHFWHQPASNRATIVYRVWVSHSCLAPPHP